MPGRARSPSELTTGDSTLLPALVEIPAASSPPASLKDSGGSWRFVLFEEMYFQLHQVGDDAQGCLFLPAGLKRPGWQVEGTHSLHLAIHT